MKAFPKVFQMVLDFFFRPMDGGGDLLCRVRALLQEGADLTPCGFRFLQLADYGWGIHPLIIARLLSRRISCLGQVIGIVGSRRQRCAPGCNQDDKAGAGEAN